MAPITEAMIRRRSEHNECVMDTLEEIVLQEEGIEKIELLGRLCPNLKQIYMPNNIIARIENMHRLKSLEYLNLAINNISKIEGLHGCEVLSRLDLTLNFVDKTNLPSVLTLQANIHLIELHLTGNPCSDFPGYRKYLVAAVPTLKRLDAVTIKPSERIVAQQDFHQLHEELLECSSGDVDESTLAENQQVQEVDDKGELVREYSASTRLAEHKEMQDLRGESERKAKAQEPKSKRRKGFDPLPVEGRIYQKNEGGWDFILTESDCGKSVVLDVAVGRFLDTSLIDIDVNPTLVRILVKGKLLQLKLPCEVKVDESYSKRSTITGNLLVTFPKVTPDAFKSRLYTTSAMPYLTKSKASNYTKKMEKKSEVKEDAKPNRSSVVNIHNIVQKNNQTSNVAQIKPSHPLKRPEDMSLEAIEWENEVPPLE